MDDVCRFRHFGKSRGGYHKVKPAHVKESAVGIEKVVATNRKARHEFEVLETFEAGLVLRGTEVKSLREGQVTFKHSYVDVQNGEAWRIDSPMTPYQHVS